MKPAYFESKAVREAYDHGRTQGQLNAARGALKAILDIAGKSVHAGKLFRIATTARIALEVTEPKPDTVYQDEERGI